MSVDVEVEAPPVPRRNERSGGGGRPASSRARGWWDRIPPTRRLVSIVVIVVIAWMPTGFPMMWGRWNRPVENYRVSNFTVQDTERVLDSPLANLQWPLTAGAADFIGLMRDADGNYILDEAGKGILDPVWAGHVTGELMEYLGGFDICKVWLEATAEDLVVHFEGEPTSPSGSAWLLDCTVSTNPEAPAQVPLADTPAEGATPAPANSEAVPGD